ncbi:MAG TPA: signal peptidase II [Pedobacter sp.]
MKLRQTLRNLVILTIVFCNIGCDQISKNIVREQIDYNESIRFLNDRLTVTKVENTGAFLSLGNNLPEGLRLFLLVLLPVITLLGAIIYIMIKQDISKVFILGACFTIGGGIGNLYDRILFGSVTDFLHISFGIFQTGIFNMADVSIMIGMGFLIVGSQQKNHRLQKTDTA